MNTELEPGTLPPVMDADGDGVPDIQDETDLDRHLEKMAELQGSRNFWDQYFYNVLFQQASLYFDEEGNRLPVLPDPIPDDPDNISPAEVHLKEGAEPTFYWTQGLEISRERSNGAVILANPWRIGHEWIENAAAVAANYGVSERSIRVAGHKLVQWSRWNMLPIFAIDSEVTPITEDGQYWIDPLDVPFTDEEITFYVNNYSASSHHGPGIFGSVGKTALFRHPTAPPGSRDAIPGHDMWVAANLPQNILPSIRRKYNTPWQMRRAWLAAVNDLHKHDGSESYPFPGGQPPEEHSQAWRDRFEDSDRRNLPPFRMPLTTSG